MLNVEVLGWRSYTWAVAVKARMDVPPNSLKRLWRQLMIEKYKFNLQPTALVDIPAASAPIAHSLKTYDIRGIVLVIKLHI